LPRWPPVRATVVTIVSRISAASWVSCASLRPRRSDGPWRPRRMDSVTRLMAPWNWHRRDGSGRDRVTGSPSAAWRGAPGSLPPPPDPVPEARSGGAGGQTALGLPGVVRMVDGIIASLDPAAGPFDQPPDAQLG